MAENEKEEKQPIIVKKVIKGGGGHHGGAWKVAYADFVTAMMAFFLLMWLLNVTTEAQKNAISSYFDPSHPKISDNMSGSGGVLGGLSVSQAGALSSTVSPFAPPSIPSPPTSQSSGETQEQGDLGPEGQEKTAEELEMEELLDELEKRAQEEEQRFNEIKEQLEKAIEESPQLKEMAENLLIDITPEGLRIQLIDQKNAAMFPSGSAQMFDRTKNLLEEVTKAILPMPNKVSVRGHTDAVPYRGRANYSNWELSTDRANSSRRVMVNAGLPLERIGNVLGKAATDPLIKDDPRAPQNRRLSIILLREATLQNLAAQKESDGGLRIDRRDLERSRTQSNRIFDF